LGKSKKQRKVKKMVQLTRIYTRGGDKGKTSLGTGTRVLKNDARIQAIGDVDELNSTLGLCRLFAEEDHLRLFEHIQNDLFDVGADLCLEDLNQEGCLRVQSSQVTWVEKTIDHFNKDLAPLTSFILPGGTALSSALHMVRSIARRAERSIVTLQQTADINDQVLIYINRLSDLFFVLARFFNEAGTKDILWKPGAFRDTSALS
jgi:cob(I)alamin adenosyltransferase